MSNGDAKITSGQMNRLQTVYSKFAKHGLDTNSREDRMRWAREFTGRTISSFKDLTRGEAKRMTDVAPGRDRATPSVSPAVKPRFDRVQGRRAGLDGRRDGKEFEKSPQLVSAQDIAVIEDFYTRLGWTRVRFDAWLASPHSPLGKRASAQIRTTAEANKVRWALKGMLQHAGLWEKSNAG